MNHDINIKPPQATDLRLKARTDDNQAQIVQALRLAVKYGENTAGK